MRQSARPISPNALPTAETSIGVMMARLGQVADRHAREVLATHNLNPRQLRILDLLANQSSIGQRELGRALHIDTSTLVHLLNPMERDGFVVRTRDAADRRRHAVSITAFGAERLAQASHAFAQIDAYLAAVLPESEREHLRGLLATLVKVHLTEPASDCGAASSNDRPGVPMVPARDP